MMRPWIRGTLVLVLALGSGIALGMAVERGRTAQGDSHAMDPVVLMRTLDRELGLDSTQRTAISGVLLRRQAAIDSAWRAVRPTVRAAIDSSQMEIVGVLRPDQVSKFLTLVQSAHSGIR